METAARRAMLDGLVLTGWTFVAIALALPWAETQDCPLFSECGPWVESSGWEEFGLPATVAFGTALVGAWVARGKGRRAVPLAVAGALGLAYILWLGWFDFRIFGEARGPLVGAWLAAAGILLAVVAGAASLLPPRQPAPPAVAP